MQKFQCYLSVLTYICYYMICMTASLKMKLYEKSPTSQVSEAVAKRYSVEKVF